MHSLFSLGSFVPKIPPSELGFVCKPELPPHINILFRARPPLKFLNYPHKGIHRNYTGVFDINNENIMDRFEKSTEKIETKLPKKVKKIIDIIKNIEIEKEKNKERAKSWNPKMNMNITSNPYKTLFIYRLGKHVDENLIKYEFEEFGKIKEIKIIKNKKGEGRGYGFIEYERTKDFREALDKGNKKKINGKRVYVEAERGRTDHIFKPLRLWNENGKGRELPLWLKDEIYKVKKNYPDIVKKAIEEGKNNNKMKEYKNKKMELEIGEIEEDKNKDDNDYIKKKRTRNKSISSYSKNSEYSKLSNSSNKSKKMKWKNDTKFYNEDYETNNQNIKKEGSEEGEID